MRTLFVVFASATILAACSSGAGNNEQEARNVKKTLDFYEKVFNAQNPALIDSFCHPDITLNIPPGMYPPGAEGLKQLFADNFAAFPDMKVTPNYNLVSGDTVVVGYTMTATMTGSWMGMPPTGKSFSVQGVDVVLLRDEKATKVMSYLEEMSMMTQLGLMPMPGAPTDTSAAAGSEPPAQ